MGQDVAVEYELPTRGAKNEKSGRSRGLRPEHRQNTVMLTTQRTNTAERTQVPVLQHGCLADFSSSPGNTNTESEQDFFFIKFVLKC